jgi:regulator of sigma E protease
MVYLIATIILLGVLIFVHEMGHFLVARYFGVRVEVFSLGFGPKLIKKQVGDTLYCLCAIPLGGYVKMFGDELDKDVPEADRKFGYLSQPIPKKAAIAFAGPAFNLIFTIIVFALLAFLGRDRLLPKIGTIFPQTAAYQAGLRTGDTLISIEGVPVKFGGEALKKINALTSTSVSLTVQRLDKNGESQSFQITAPLTTHFGHNEFGQVKPISEISGFDLMIHLPQIEVIGKQSWAMQSGFQDKDVITKIDTTSISSIDEILPTLKLVASTNQNFNVVVSRTDSEDTTCLGLDGGCPSVTLKITAPQSINQIQFLQQIGFAPTELSVGKVKPNSTAEKEDLRSNDVIVAAGGQIVTYFEQFRNLIQTYGKQDKALPITVDRNGKAVAMMIKPEPLTEKDVSGQPWVAKNYPFAIGIYPYVNLYPQQTLYRETNPIVAIGIGFTQTWDWSIRFGVGIWKLVTGQISTKMLSGPIYIGKMAGDMIQAGIRQFLFLMAIISLNLGLINLLPIPVLDGGHLLFFAIEGVLRRKPSIKIMERAFQIGMAFIILLSLFAIYNDLLRVLN